MRYKKNMVQTDRHIVNGIIVRRMHFACSIIKATDTHSECVIEHLLPFPGNDGYANANQSYIYLYTASLVNYMPIIALTITN